MSSTLRLDEAATLEVIFQRSGVRGGDGDLLSEALLEMDDCVDILDKTDARLLEQTKKQAVAKEASSKEFMDAYTKKLQVVRTAATSSSSRRPTSSSSSSGASQLPRRTPWAFEDTQPSMRRFAPPTCSVWRMKQRGGWAGHHSRASVSASNSHPTPHKIKSCASVRC